MRTSLLVVAFLLLLISCGGREETASTNAGTDGGTDTMPAAPDTAQAQFDPERAKAESAPAAAIALVQKDVQVTLGDDGIQFTPTLPPSEVTFNVTNAGSQEHGFAIGGGEINARLDRTLQPGQSSKLVVALRPGTYKVWCPVGDHESRGASRSLVAQ